MRVHCSLRTIRGRRRLRELADAAGVNAGTLSAIERGRTLPKDEWVEPLEQAYGQAITEWYPRPVLLALQPDEEDA